MRTGQSLLHGLVLQTNDPEEAAACLREAAVPYVSEVLPGSPPFSTQIFVMTGPRVRLSRVVTHGLMRVEARLPEDSYALILDLQKGVGLHRVEGRDIVVGPQFGFLQSPLQAVEVKTEAEYEVLFVRISRKAMMEELNQLLGQPARTDLVFDPAVTMGTEAGRRMRGMSDDLRRMLCSSGDGGMAVSPALRQMESDLITLLLQAQPHNYRRFLNRGLGANNWQVSAAEEFMRANAHLPVSLGDVCQAAGVNARTLQDSFRKKRGCTPMEFLRETRMEHVRAGLCNPAEEASVAGEAARWGFLHFGRFSSEYRARYGELPSQTLRRARGKGTEAKRA